MLGEVADHRSLKRPKEGKSRFFSRDVVEDVEDGDGACFCCFVEKDKRDERFREMHGRRRPPAPRRWEPIKEILTPSTKSKFRTRFMRIKG